MDSIHWIHSVFCKSARVKSDKPHTILVLFAVAIVIGNRICYFFWEKHNITFHRHPDDRSMN